MANGRITKFSVDLDIENKKIILRRYKDDPYIGEVGSIEYESSRVKFFTQLWRNDSHSGIPEYICNEMDLAADLLNQE